MNERFKKVLFFAGGAGAAVVGITAGAIMFGLSMPFIGAAWLLVGGAHHAAVVASAMVATTIVGGVGATAAVSALAHNKKIKGRGRSVLAGGLLATAMVAGPSVPYLFNQLTAKAPVPANMVKQAQVVGIKSRPAALSL